MGIESVPFSMLEDSEVADMEAITGDEAVPISTIWILKKLTQAPAHTNLCIKKKKYLQHGC